MEYTSEYINEEEIEGILAGNASTDEKRIDEILSRAEQAIGISIEDCAVLLNVNDKETVSKIMKSAGRIKDRIYGNRVVFFAPLYISNYCINGCKYCGFCSKNTDIARRTLTIEEVKKETEILLKMGHKRIALEAGEDPKNCDFEYILEAIRAIYSVTKDNGNIRRINVNIASTTVEKFKRLKDENIGTYILFQETYHRPTYQYYHPTGPKKDFDYHLSAMDRAMEAGIDDVGIGALFGLYDYKYEVIAILKHAEHLEKVFGVGPHTVSVPRIKKAYGINEEYPHSVSDDEFEKLVAIIRLALPYTGIILSTREEADFREKLINAGVSQLSAASNTDVGGYVEQYENKRVAGQFEVADHRSLMDVIQSIMKHGFIPSFCTGCYRQGRTGDRFMALAKSGKIHLTCLPNAIITLKEYLLDYCDEETIKIGNQVIEKELANIPEDCMRTFVRKSLYEVEHGRRDIFV